MRVEIESGKRERERGRDLLVDEYEERKQQHIEIDQSSRLLSSSRSLVGVL